MKKIYLLTIVLVLTAYTQGIGQYASVFGEESTEWSYASLSCDAGPTAILSVSRDTVVDNIEYQIITRVVYQDVSDIGLLRETEDGSKLWFRNFDSSNEVLIMDLDLTLSDSFTIGAEMFMVDSIYMNDNSLKVIEMDLILDWCGPEFIFTFTEGLGPNLGFDYIGSPSSYFFPSIISCHTKDGTTVNYLSQFNDECAPFTLSNQNISVGALDIYPNPTIGQLIIKLPDIESGAFSVKSLTGQVVYTDQFDITEELSLNLYGQDPGIYIIELESDEGNRYLERVVLY